jgi:hypothetical protein
MYLRHLSTVSRNQGGRLIGRTLAALIVAGVTLLAVLVVSVRAWWAKPDVTANQASAGARLNHGVEAPPLQNPLSGVPDLQARLALQPEADRFRRRLGQRFLTPGREMSVLVGQLTVGTERYTARIIRNQADDDERLTVALNGGPPTLTWSGLGGAQANGSSANGDVRALIERLALDSPDQFILAQLRGASYYNIASHVRPAEVGGSGQYRGPVWSIVRVGEPSTVTQGRPQSRWRLFYINEATGLIDKIVSKEQDGNIVAEFSGWVEQAGEQAPTRITWTRNKQVVMELKLNNIGHGPKQ